MRIIVFVFLGVLMACGTGKESKSDRVKDSDDLGKGSFAANGVIRDYSAKSACSFLIEIYTKTDTFLAEPLTIPELFKREGQRVEINYRLSRRASTCELATPIIIDKIIGAK